MRRKADDERLLHESNGQASGETQFEDGTVTNSSLSWKAFRQLVEMKAGKAQVRLTPPVAAAVPVNGPK